MTRTIHLQLLVLLSLSIASMNGQVTHNVPADFTEIQTAIHEASSGDTIVVAPGTYFENIDYTGKNIYLTSEYLYTGERSSIVNTIIDGSQPMHPDTGCVVRFINDEDAAAVLQGFTIQGGSGMRTFNEAEELYFRTGGGVNCNASSPKILDNIIRDNHCTNGDDVTGAGGGGLRVGFGQPYLARNTIIENSGGYAGGIMIAFCEGMLMENNIIAYNHSDGDFGGGGGVYVDWENVDIINNTIVHNDSDYTGGGLCITGNTSTIKNCIIQNNIANVESTVSFRLRFDGNPQVSYSNVGGGWDGEGNIDLDPQFSDTVRFELDLTSPSVDAGDPNELYDDIEDADSPGLAALPAKGTVHNDMGAHGGPNYTPGSSVTALHDFSENTLSGIQSYLSGESLILQVEDGRSLTIEIHDVSGKLLEHFPMTYYTEGIHSISINSRGLLLFKFQDRYGTSALMNSYR